MLKKILSLFMLPLFALSLLAGCGGDKSVDDIKNYYAAIKEKHITETKIGESSVYNSWLFEKTSGNQFSDNITILYDDELGKRLNPTTESDLTRINQVLPNTMPTYCTDTNLYYRYYALVYVQQPILNAIFNYYINWSENFYDGMKLVDSKKLDEEDLNHIYEKLEALDEELDEFSQARDKFQSDVNVLGFGGINRSVITTYSLKVNELIEKSYDFVNAFKDVHVKYIWDGVSYSSKEKVGTIDCLNRLVDEANLNIAYSIYTYIKGFEASECDLSWFIKEHKGEYYGDVLKSWFEIEDFKLKYLTVESVDKISDEQAIAEKSSIDKFNYARQTFNQKLEVFNEIYPQVNLNAYLRILYNIDSSNSAQNVEMYINQLCEVERANFNLVINFYKETMENYKQQLLTMTSADSKVFLVVPKVTA